MLEQNNKEELALLAGIPSVASYMLSQDGLRQDLKMRKLSKIPTSFPQLDDALGGGLEQGLYILGGVSGCGKTTFMNQMADNLAERNKNVFYYAIESANDELFWKSIAGHIFNSPAKNTLKYSLGWARMAKHYDFDDENNSLYETEKNVVSVAMKNYFQKIAKRRANICACFGADGCTTGKLMSQIEDFMKFLDEPPVIFIDSISIIQRDQMHSSDSDITHLQRVMGTLKMLSMKYHITIICSCELNRASYYEAVQRESFKGSGSIEYQSDYLLGMNLTKTFEIQGKVKAGMLSVDVDDYAKGSDVKTIIQDEMAKEKRDITIQILKGRQSKPFTKIEFEYFPASDFFRERL